MEIRRGILGGTTLLFAMTGAACPDAVDGSDAATTADVSADLSDGAGGDGLSGDMGAQDGTAQEIVTDTPGVDGSTADLPSTDTALADVGLDATFTDGGPPADGSSEDVSEDPGGADTTAVDAAAGDVAATDADVAGDVCQEPTADPADLVGKACDSPFSQSLCADQSEPSTTLVYCDGSGIWAVPSGPADLCNECWPVACGWDYSDCGVAIGYIGIGTSGMRRRALRRVRVA